MKIIQIGASSKKAGKTTLAEYLVGELRADFALKISPGGHHAGIGPLTTDPEIISKSGTDTGRLVRAGAKSVIWVNAKRDDLEHYIDKALSMFGEEGLLIVEGNSGSKYLHADFTVFIMNRPVHMFKESAHLTLSKSNLVLANLSGELSGIEKADIESEIHMSAPDAEIIEFIDVEQDTAYKKASEVIRKKQQV